MSASAGQKKRGNNRGDNHTLVIRPWTSGELAELRRLAGKVDPDTLSTTLGRSRKAILRAAERHRISLRRQGERRGRILGQPRGVSLVADNRVRLRLLRNLREDVIAGRVDPARLERRIRAITRGAPLCPSCVVRPVEVRWTGLCEDCHLHQLADQHRIEADRLEAQRGLDGQRQRKHRAAGGS